MSTVKSEDAAAYNIQAVGASVNLDDDIILKATEIIRSRLRQPGEAFTHNEGAKRYFVLRMAQLEHEEFHILCLNSLHQLLACETMFRGTIDGASIYLREVVKVALRHNAAAVIFGHNHPSGNPTPSNQDESITARLKQALELVDVRVLDHIIVGGVETVSLAERGCYDWY